MMKMVSVPCQGMFFNDFDDLDVSNTLIEFPSLIRDCFFNEEKKRHNDFEKVMAFPSLIRDSFFNNQCIWLVFKNNSKTCFRPLSGSLFLINDTKTPVIYVTFPSLIRDSFFNRKKLYFSKLVNEFPSLIRDSFFNTKEAYHLLKNELESFRPLSGTLFLINIWEM